MAVWLAARDRRTPIVAKLLAGAVAAYAFSPIDLIPDFVPVLGLLDDLLIVPTGIWLATRLIPAPLMTELRERADGQALRPSSRIAAVFVIMSWLVTMLVLVGYLARRR